MKISAAVPPIADVATVLKGRMASASSGSDGSSGPGLSSTAMPASLRTHLQPASSGNGRGIDATSQSFEAYLLQTVFEAILPKDSEALFGKGVAGDAWKSMLAEHIAKEVSRSGGLGVAAIIEAGPRPSKTLP